MFQVKFETSRYQKALRQYPRIFGLNLRLGLKIHARDVQESARGKHRFTTRSGEAEASVDTKYSPSRFRSSVGFNESAVKHGKFLHDGTKPHIISRKNKKALRWIAGGKFRFAKSIKHPGTAPDPFIVNAAKRLKSAFTRRMRMAARNAMLGRVGVN